MSFVDSSGNILNKTELLALTTEQSTTVQRKLTADVYQKFTQDGGPYEGATKLLFHNGQVVTEDLINGLYETATVTDIDPATGPAAGGTVVTIDGTNLAGVEGVTFGGTAGTALKRLSDTRIQVTTPAKSAGAYNVVVQDDAGNVTVTNGFTYA